MKDRVAQLMGKRAPKARHVVDCVNLKGLPNTYTQRLKLGSRFVVAHFFIRQKGHLEAVHSLEFPTCILDQRHYVRCPAILGVQRLAPALSQPLDVSGCVRWVWTVV